MKANPIVPSRKTAAAASRVQSIASRLRVREDWVLDTAAACRSWTIRLDGSSYRIDAHLSAFLEPADRAGFVVSLNLRSARATRPVPDAFTATPWFEGLRGRLGSKYGLHVAGGTVSLLRSLRSAAQSTVLDELRHVSAAMAGKRRSRQPARTEKASARSARDNLWALLDKLRASAWQLSSVTHTLRTSARDGRHEWMVAASLIAMVDSNEGPPGFAGSVCTWPTSEARAKPSSRLLAAFSHLEPAGYRRMDTMDFIRWHRGLGLRDVEREIALLEQCVRGTKRTSV